MADAYCLRRPCRIERAERTVFAPFEPFELSQTLSDVVDLPEKGGEVLFCAASAALPVRTDGSVRLTAAVHAAYAPEDAAPDTVVRRLQAEWRREADAAASLCAVPSVYDTAALIRGDTLELRCGVTVPYMSAAEKTLRFVRAAEPDERPGAERGEGPSAVVVRAGKRTAWELAKRYGSTVALIEAVNPADAPLWLIPRAR